MGAARVTVLQELPWFFAGGARLEALEEVSSGLCHIRAGLGALAYSQKVLPVETACSLMRGRQGEATTSSEAWVRVCEDTFGHEDTHRTVRARRLAMEIVTLVQSQTGSLSRALERA